MRKMIRLATWFFGCAALVLIFAGTAEAQLKDALRVDIPFDFHVGDDWCPAGEYVIAETQPGVYSIRNEDTGVGNFVLTLPEERPTRQEANTLVFHQIGNEHFLSKIWRDGRNLGGMLPVSATETEAAIDLGERAEQVARAH